MPVKVDSQNNNTNNNRNNQGLSIDVVRHSVPFRQLAKPLMVSVPLCSKIA